MTPMIFTIVLGLELLFHYMTNHFHVADEFWDQGTELLTPNYLTLQG